MKLKLRFFCATHAVELRNVTTWDCLGLDPEVTAVAYMPAGFRGNTGDGLCYKHRNCKVVIYFIDETKGAKKNANPGPLRALYTSLTRPFIRIDTDPYPLRATGDLQSEAPGQPGGDGSDTGRVGGSAPDD